MEKVLKGKGKKKKKQAIWGGKD